MTVAFSDYEPRVKSATHLADQHLVDLNFYELMAAHKSFDLASPNATPSAIAEQIKNSTLVFKVKIFYLSLIQGLFKCRKTLAYADGAYQATLFLDFKKLHRVPAEITANIIHEATHAQNGEETKCSFGHCNNSPVSKQNTAPLWISNIAYQLITDCATKRHLFSANQIKTISL